MSSSSIEVVEIISEPTTVEIYTDEPSLVEVLSPGPQGGKGATGGPGPQGPPGPEGPPGAPGSAPQAYVHGQSIPNDVWHVVHNLGYFPNVTVVDSAGTEVEGLVDYVDDNTLDIIFAFPFGGFAYLS